MSEQERQLISKQIEMVTSCEESESSSLKEMAPLDPKGKRLTQQTGEGSHSADGNLMWMHNK